MKECKCTMSQRVLGDGCEVCNPELAVELYKETISDLESQLRTLAQAVLEAHTADALTDLDGNGNWVQERIGCQCEACKQAREILK